MMGQFEQLDQMLTEQEGMLRTSQVVSSGISKPVFYDYVRSRDLDRVAHGIYLSKDSFGCPGYFRMAYCIDTEKVVRSLDALERFVKTEYPDR